MKEAIKRSLGHEGNPSLIDTDRITPKAEGGTYEDGNVRLLAPREHMARHGNLRERTEILDEIKSVMDDRAQMMKVMLKINNQLLAYQRRTDERHPDTEAWLSEQVDSVVDRLKGIDRVLKGSKDVEGLIPAYAEVDALAAAALGVPYMGEITLANLVTYVDLEKAPSASSLWKYAGLHKPSHRRYELDPGEEVTKGRGGNKTLRTALYNVVNVMWRAGDKSAYRLVGDRVKERLSESERIVESRTTQGALVKVAWKDTKRGHRHGAALRAMMKHLLADYWFVGRELAGLSTRPLYVQEKLGHTGIISPRERGWDW